MDKHNYQHVSTKQAKLTGSSLSRGSYTTISSFRTRSSGPEVQRSSGPARGSISYPAPTTWCQIPVSVLLPVPVLSTLPWKAVSSSSKFNRYKRTNSPTFSSVSMPWDTYAYKSTTYAYKIQGTRTKVQNTKWIPIFLQHEIRHTVLYCVVWDSVVSGLSTVRSWSIAHCLTVFVNATPRRRSN